MTTLEVFTSTIINLGQTKIDEVLNSNKKEVYLCYIGGGKYDIILTNNYLKISAKIRKYACTNMVRDLNDAFKTRLREALK